MEWWNGTVCHEFTKYKVIRNESEVVFKRIVSVCYFVKYCKNSNVLIKYYPSADERRRWKKPSRKRVKKERRVRATKNVLETLLHQFLPSLPDLIFWSSTYCICRPWLVECYHRYVKSLRASLHHISESKFCPLVHCDMLEWNMPHETIRSIVWQGTKLKWQKQIWRPAWSEFHGKIFKWVYYLFWKIYLNR